MAKEVWSRNYGRNPSEGVHKFLEKNIVGYKRKNVHSYIKGFAKFAGKDKPDTILLASYNFSKWVQFLKANGFVK